MNLLEHYVLCVYDVKDVTDELGRLTGRKSPEPLVEVQMRVNCYGRVSETERTFRMSEWELVKSQGYYLA